MHNKIKKAIRYVTREGLQYTLDQLKSYYPWLKSKSDDAEKNISKIKKEAVPALSKKTDDISKYVLKKYEEAKKLSKKAEKNRKRAKMNSIRNTIIATTLGFGAGAATGYVLVKKSQIKESDYVFKDDEVVENTPFEKKEQPPTETKASEGSGKVKMYSEFNDKYSISEDGINLIKK